MKPIIPVFRCLLSGLTLLLAARLHAADIHVFAAASLTDVLKEIAAEYQKETGDKLVFNFAASSLLARQIQEGAPADVFFSADEEKMDGLERKGLLVKETRRRLLSNTLVIVVAKEGDLKLESPKDLAGNKVSQSSTRCVLPNIFLASSLSPDSKRSRKEEPFRLDSVEQVGEVARPERVESPVPPQAVGFDPELYGVKTHREFASRARTFQ
jgi:hypothetical protein